MSEYVDEPFQESAPSAVPDFGEGQAMGSGDTYVAAIAPADCFVDHSYQRILDVPRARKITADCEPSHEQVHQTC